MTQTGKVLRLGRILDSKTNRTVIVAMDHGLFMGPVEGLEKPAEVAEKALKAGANALVITPGVCRLIAEKVKGRAGIILRVDGATTMYGCDFFDIRRISSVKDALMAGADAVIAMGYIGSPKENETLASLSFIARQCEEFGVPLVAEMLPVQCERIKDPYDAGVISLAARVGAEIGADLIKTYYTGSEKTFREVVGSCPVPIVIAGGPKMKTGEDALNVANDAVNAGAVGVAFGRNIWQHEAPECMTKALVKIVNTRTSVKQAMKEFEQR